MVCVWNYYYLTSSTTIWVLQVSFLLCSSLSKSQERTALRQWYRPKQLEKPKVRRSKLKRHKLWRTDKATIDPDFLLTANFLIFRIVGPTNQVALPLLWYYSPCFPSQTELMALKVPSYSLLYSFLLFLEVRIQLNLTFLREYY